MPKSLKRNKIDDETIKCVRCNRGVLIKPNQVGGFWYLNGYKDKKGKEHYGGHCPKCFDKLKG